MQVDITDLHDDDADGNVFLLSGLVDDCKLDNSVFNLSECEGNKAIGVTNEVFNLGKQLNTWTMIEYFKCNKLSMGFNCCAIRLYTI